MPAEAILRGKGNVLSLAKDLRPGQGCRAVGGASGAEGSDLQLLDPLVVLVEEQFVGNFGVSSVRTGQRLGDASATAQAARVHDRGEGVERFLVGALHDHAIRDRPLLLLLLLLFGFLLGAGFLACALLFKG